MYHKINISHIFIIVIIILLATPKVLLSMNKYSLDDILVLAKKDNNHHNILYQQKIISEAENEILVSYALPKTNFDINALRTGYHKNEISFSSIPNLPDRFYGNNFSWNLNIQGPLYSFGRLGHLYQAYELQKDLINTTLENSKNRYYYKVILTFIHALQSLTQRNLMGKSKDYANKLYQFTKIEFEQGNRNRIDLLRSKSFYSKSQTNFESAVSNYEISKKKLQILLGIDENTPFELDPKLELNSKFFSMTQNEKSKGEDFSLKILKINSEITKELSIYKGLLHLPSISWFGRLTSAAQKNETLNINQSISDSATFSNITYQAGINFTWVLFDGFKTSEEFRKARATAQLSSLNYELENQSKKIAILESKNKLTTSQKIFKAQKESVEASKLFFEQVDRDFRAGTASLSDAFEAEKILAQEEQESLLTYTKIISETANLKHLLGLDY